MSTLHVSLHEALKVFVDAQVSEQGYGTSSESVLEVIRKDQERMRLRALLLAGYKSPAGPPADAGHFEVLRARVRKGSAGGR